MLFKKLKGLYVITDDKLTPHSTIVEQVQKAIKGGANIVQLRDKKSPANVLETIATTLQELCKEYGVLFVLNDDIELAIKLQCDGLHIGKSDYHRFEEIRHKFDGVIGVSCYGDIQIAKEFEAKGADYVAFGSFFHSFTKPNSNIVPLDTITKAKEILNIPICVIGGINSDNIGDIMEYEPDMVAVIYDIWKSENIIIQSNLYANQF